MDDGGWTGSGIRISTNSYTLQELNNLVKFLHTKFNLICTLQKIHMRASVSKQASSNFLKTKRKTGTETGTGMGTGKEAKAGINQQYSIYITSQSISDLRKIILPYMHKSMLYKLGL